MIILLVKCRACGQKIDRNDAFKVVVGGKNAYYCNEEEYLAILKERENKKMMYDLINQIFGYTIVNTALYKEINPLVETYGYTMISSYLKENFDYLYDAIHRLTSKEYGKIRYFSTILCNKLHDYSENVVVEEPKKFVEVSVDIEEVRYRRKKKKRSLEQIEQEIGD